MNFSSIRRFGLFVCLILLVPTAIRAERWIKAYTGGTYLFSVIPTADGGYAACGTAGSSGILLKVDAQGNQQWLRNFSSVGILWQLKQASDGGYILCGISPDNVNLVLIKTDNQGNEVWSRTFTNGYMAGGLSVDICSDGGYIGAGFAVDQATGNYDLLLVRTNASGNPLWQRIYNLNDAGCYQRGMNVEQTQDGGFMVATHSWNGYNDIQYCLFKADGSGNQVWLKYYGIVGQDTWECGRDGHQCPDGGYIMSGGRTLGGDSHLYIIKTNASGDTVWSRVYGTPVESWSYQGRIGDIVIVPSGGYAAICGFYAQIMRIGPNGDSLWCVALPQPLPNVYWRAYSIEVCSDQGYIVAGYGYYGGSYYLVLAKTDSLGNTGVAEDWRPGLIGSGYQATPNPFVAFTTIPNYEKEVFTIYDASGRSMGISYGARVGEDLCPGVYFLCPKQNPGHIVRIVKVR